MPSILVAGGDGLGAGGAMVDGEVEGHGTVAADGIERRELRVEI